MQRMDRFEPQHWLGKSPYGSLTQRVNFMQRYWSHLFRKTDRSLVFISSPGILGILVEPCEVRCGFPHAIEV